jgi:chemotaxis family two-component system sensor kinase Cph1
MDIITTFVNPSIEQLGLGDHVAYFVRSNAERLAFVIPYIAIGLRRGERCMYIAEDNSVARIYEELQKAGVDVDKATSSGALSVMTKRETYLRYGMFEPEKMIYDLNCEVKRSLDQGFSGFRASGEMSWALDLPSALARLVEYEEQLQALWPAEFGGVCQYDVTRFPADLIARLKRIHEIYVENNEIVRRKPGLAFEYGKIDAMRELGRP